MSRHESAARSGQHLGAVVTLFLGKRHAFARRDRISSIPVSCRCCGGSSMSDRDDGSRCCASSPADVVLSWPFSTPIHFFRMLSVSPEIIDVSSADGKCPQLGDAGEISESSGVAPSPLYATMEGVRKCLRQVRVQFAPGRYSNSAEKPVYRNGMEIEEPR